MSRKKYGHYQTIQFFSLVAAALLAGAPSPGRAQTQTQYSGYFMPTTPGGTGDWSVATNWNSQPDGSGTTGVPTYKAEVSNGGTATISIAGSGGYLVGGYLTVGGLNDTSGDPTTGDGTVVQNAGTCASVYEAIGNYGNGTFVQNGGLNMPNNVQPSSGYLTLYLGNSGPGLGSYQLNGGAFQPVLEYIGNSGGAGVFNQTGGTNGIAQGVSPEPPTLVIGSSVAGPIAPGTYNLQGGLMLTGCQYVGEAASGTFNQSGGTNDLVGGGTYNPNSTMDNIDGILEIGNNFSSERGGGTYNLSGGLLQALSATSGLNTGGEVVGNTGTGYFVQTGGTNLASDITVQGSHPKYNGSSYTLSNTGLIIAVNESVYGTKTNIGTFTQTGGTNSVTYSYGGFTLTGNYNLSGGVFQLAGMGYDNTGVFNFTGGTVQALQASSGTAWMQVAITLGTASSGAATFDANGHTLMLNYGVTPSPLSGPGNLTVIDSVGGGTVVLGTNGTQNLPLTVANLYTGGTTVLSGTLEVVNTSALPTTSILTVGGPTAVVLNVQAGTLFGSDAVGQAAVVGDGMGIANFSPETNPSGSPLPTLASGVSMVSLASSPAAVPEPSTLALLGAGLLSLLRLKRRKIG